MIRFFDALVLAHTKLRVHTIRTGVAVAIAGLLFGLIAAVIIVTQGIFVSFDEFSDEGLNNRTLLNITRSGGMRDFNEYEQREDPAFVIEVETAHKALVTKKQAAALRFGVQYSPEIEDPSPIGIDPLTKKKGVKETDLNNVVVQDIANKKRQDSYTPFDINEHIKKYASASVIQELGHIQPSNGALTFMKDGKEAMNTSDNRYTGSSEETPVLSILSESVSAPFISEPQFDPAKGEIPVIVPYGAAEKILGLKKLGANTTMQEQYDRLQEVRSKIGEVTASYCYRNVASQALLSRALGQQEEMKYGAVEPGYVKPAVIYSIPDETSCGAVTIESDTRTTAQKQYDAQYVLYEKEIGTYAGEPEQKLVTVRGVGISSEIASSGQWSIADITKNLLSSSLGYGSWTVPEHLFNQLPAEVRPDSIFKRDANALSQGNLFYGFESYLVEFGDKEEARTLLGGASYVQSGDVFVSPFGSGVLVMDEFKRIFTQVLLWTFVIIGGVAVIILTGIVGRTVADGRRESSIFRAIGASRLDIASVYGVFVLLLALRIVIFTAILAVTIGLVLEVLFWQDATLGARLAYAASDTSKEFHLFSLTSPYLLWIVGIIVAASIIASIIPILLGARRNPIKDMRNE